jgi:hypothetical protein
MVSKCEKCLQLNDAYARALKAGKREALDKVMEHRLFIRSLRHEYYSRRQRATRHPEQFCSIIIGNVNVDAISYAQ